MRMSQHPQHQSFNPQNFRNEQFLQQPQRQNVHQQTYQHDQFQQQPQDQFQRQISQRPSQRQQVAQGQQIDVSVPQHQHPQQTQQNAPQETPQQKSPRLGTPRPSLQLENRRTSRELSLSQDPSRNRLASPAGRFFLSSVGIRVKTLSYEGFATVYFEFGRAEKDLSKQFLNKCLRFTPREITRPLLKNLYGVKTTWMAVTIFSLDFFSVTMMREADILAYMELIPGVTNAKFKHTYQILSAGISRPDLRDEIYCQLCRQTNYNMNGEKDKKGWELLLLCSSSFPPSKDFLPALEGHFQQVAGGAVKGFKGDEQAKRCLERLQRVAKAGPRYFLPSNDEIEAIRSETTLPLTLYLLNGTNQVRSVHTMTTTSEISYALAEELGLPDPSQYGIFQSGTDGVEKLCPQLGYIIDIQNGWDKNLKLQTLEDWRLIKRIKLFFASKAPVNEVDEANDISSIPTLGQKMGRLMLKRKLFLDVPAAIDQSIKETSIEFDYNQAVHEVMTGSYLLKSRDALMLGALQLRVDREDNKNYTEKFFKGLELHKYEPKSFVIGNREDWRADLIIALQTLPEESNKSLRMSDYVDYMKSRCPLCQSTWIFVKQKGDLKLPEELFVAINATGVYFADPITKFRSIRGLCSPSPVLTELVTHLNQEAIMRIPFTQICSWGHSVAAASLVTGNMTNNHEYRLITRQGAEIGAAIELFISRMLT